jgi:hypothetical protein
MRWTTLVFGVLICSAMATSAQADPYRWCAEYGGIRGGAALIAIS